MGREGLGEERIKEGPPQTRVHAHMRSVSEENGVKGGRFVWEKKGKVKQKIKVIIYSR